MKLLIVGDDGSERIVELSDRTLQIGRGAGNDIVLPDAAKGASRTHAELRFRNGRYVIIDLQSQNGTWLNGKRVQHAEVPLGGEIAVGSYKLRLVSDDARIATPDARITEAWPVPMVSEPRPGAGVPVPAIERQDLPLRAEPVVRPAPRARAAAQSASSRGRLIGALTVIVSVAVITWFGTRTPREAAQPASQAAPVAPAPTVSPVVDAPSKPVSIGRGEPGQVVRKPGETIEAWRAREIACQTRYAYSREALDRGDFAAAAGGFEAILRDEPGFLDAPALLVKARAGLREAALEMFQAAQRLEAAGDWSGALQKYEQAGQIQADLPGLPEAIRRMREKVRDDLDLAHHPRAWPVRAAAERANVDFPPASRAGARTD